MQSLSDQLNTSMNLSFQQIIEPQIKLTNIKSNHYFILINKKLNKALTYRPNLKYSEQHAVLQQINENDIQQIFQIQQIQQQKYQIVHGISTLVLTNQQNEVMLNFGKWKNNQFFYPQKVNDKSEKLQFYIKSSKGSNKYLYHDGFGLRCGNKYASEQDLVWQIRLCLHNQRLNKSCWLQYVFSNQVIDIPEATDKTDVNLIQYPCNYRFNQRFFIIKDKNQKQLYKIQSLKTNLYLTVSSNPFYTSIVQQNQINDKKNKQLWKIQYVGNGLYHIKSALKQNMYLIVKDRSTKLSQILTISGNQNFCLWKIVGNFNIMPNKDSKF